MHLNCFRSVAAQVLFVTAILICPHDVIHADEGYSQIRDFSGLRRLVATLADEPASPRAVLPTRLAEMNYDDYLLISFQPKRATWWGQLPTCFETFHRGFVQRDRVRVFTVDPLETNEVPFRKMDFNYQPPFDSGVVPDDLGHAGLKLISTLSGVEGGQELLTFLGASYFRGRSGDTRYGTSSRGLGIDIAMNQDEEFPRFNTFWIVRPSQNSHEITILALLDSESVVGAYRFQFSPGQQESRLKVQSRLHFRRKPGKIALAPLTSMWMWGDGLKGPPLDARPAVHDSDGLLVKQTVGVDCENPRWSWRAFARQSYPSVSHIEVSQLEGFGLMQRNRSFYHFDDHNARYDLRPSVWVTPAESWQDGKVELLELPGAHEGIDNIAAYWTPNTIPRAGEAIDLDYTVSFFAGDHGQQRFLGRATNFEMKRHPEDNAIELVIRFSGPALRQMCDQAQVTVNVAAIRGNVIRKSAEPTETGDWLVTVRIQPTEDSPPELAIDLTDAGRFLSERFQYLCPPAEPKFVYPAVYTRVE